ncbi:MAG: MotA/TolQ/ExbB proton channel family protein [Schlesneria sp.]
MPDRNRSTRSEAEPLSWARDDVEQQMMFRGGRFTRVNSWCSFTLAVVMTGVFYAVLFPFHGNWIAGSFFFDRNRETPACIVFLSCWSIAILGLKWSKLRMQRRSLKFGIVPDDPEFVLTPQNVDEVFQRMHERVDDTRHFVVFHRITSALSNLRNLGRVTDVGDILRAQAETDESAMETSYSLLQGFVWAIPVLGFIGTVEGLSVAIGGFGGVLASSSDFEQIKMALRGVTGGLSTAFETTLHGLVAALAIQLTQTGLKKSEEEFLDECSEYCSKQIVSRLRLMPFELRGDE